MKFQCVYLLLVFSVHPSRFISLSLSRSHTRIKRETLAIALTFSSRCVPFRCICLHTLVLMVSVQICYNRIKRTRLFLFMHEPFMNECVTIQVTTLKRKFKFFWMLCIRFAWSSNTNNILLACCMRHTDAQALSRTHTHIQRHYFHLSFGNAGVVVVTLRLYVVVIFSHQFHS